MSQNRRQRTPNQDDFIRLRTATLEIVHPSRPEPWERHRPDGNVEQLQRRVDEDLPLLSIRQAIEEKHTIRIYFNSVRDVLLALPSGQLTRLNRTFDKSGRQTACETEDAGTWSFEALDNRVPILCVDNSYGEEVEHTEKWVRYTSPRGDGFASPHFSGIIHLHIVNCKTKRKDEDNNPIILPKADVSLPIYEASLTGLKAARQEFLKRMAKRDTLGMDFIKDKNIPLPFVTKHEGYLLSYVEMKKGKGASRFIFQNVVPEAKATPQPPVDPNIDKAKEAMRQFMATKPTSLRGKAAKAAITALMSTGQSRYQAKKNLKDLIDGKHSIAA